MGIRRERKIVVFRTRCRERERFFHRAPSRSPGRNEPRTSSDSHEDSLRAEAPPDGVGAGKAAPALIKVVGSIGPFPPEPSPDCAGTGRSQSPPGDSKWRMPIARRSKTPPESAATMSARTLLRRKSQTASTPTGSDLLRRLKANGRIGSVPGRAFQLQPQYS